jgi:hypothetical protein
MILLAILRVAFIAALLALAPTAALAAQATYVMPVAGPHSMADLTTNYFNPAFAAILSCNSGATAPAVSGQPVVGQCWLNTSTTPRQIEIYDGSQWIIEGYLDTSGHTFSPTGSQLTLLGSSSGTVTIMPQAAAGTPALSLPTASGTFAVNATLPLVLSPTTGNLTCPTCATTTSGGSLSGTGVVAVSSGGAISITGAAGQVLAGATPAFTATPTLGVAGSSAGSLAFANTTSGSVTVAPPTGALGAVTLTLPAATDTLVARATTDTLTNKTLDTAGAGNVLKINGTTISAVTGSGAAVLATSPTLTTPAIGAAAGTSLSLSGLTASSAVATDASKNLVSVANTGTGSNVLATAPTLVTPTLGVATATSINKVTVTAPATGSTLTIADGKTATVSNTLTLAGTDATTMTFPSTSATIARTDAANTFTGHQTLEGVTSTGATGTGNLVFSTSPTLTTPALGTPSAIVLTSGTGLPISTGVSGLGTGVATWLGTPSSANLAAAVTGGTGSGALVFGTSPTISTPVLNGLPTGSGVAASPTASTLVSRDANASISANAFLPGYATTVTAAGTTTLTVASPQLQYFTGSTTQTVALPVVSTLVLGQSFTVSNNSSGAVAVNSSGANLVLSVAAGNTGIFTVVLTTGTTAASWSSTYISSGAGTGTVTSVTCGAPLTGGTFTTTGTCTFPSGTQWGLPYYSASTSVASTAAGTTTTILHGNAAGAPTWASLAYADIASGALAASSDYRSNTASTLLGPNAVWSAAGGVALTDAATILVDMSTGINFTVTLAGNRTLGAPSNTKVGQTGVFRISQDATGTRTLAYNSVYKFAGGTACTLTTTASKNDYVFYFVYSSSEILLSCVLNVSMLDAPANDNFALNLSMVG